MFTIRYMSSWLVPEPRQPPMGAGCRSVAGSHDGKDAELMIVTADKTAIPAGREVDASAVERALAAAVRDSARVGDLLDALSRGRLWLPLPEDGRPVTDGSAVNLPVVTYLGSDFVPAYTSVGRLLACAASPDGTRTCAAARGSTGPGTARQRAAWSGAAGTGTPETGTAETGTAETGTAETGTAETGTAGASTAGTGPAGTGTAGTGPAGASTAQPPLVVPHVVVPAAELARRLPGTLGIALNPGAGESVPVYPEGVAYLAAARFAPGAATGIRVGHPPSEPVALLAGIGSLLPSVPAARAAATAWLSVELAGEGLIISVTLDDPADQAAKDAVVGAIERAAAAAPQDTGFPIDVTFPGEGAPDQVDEWISAHGSPFYIRP